MSLTQIKEGIYWVGAVDWSIRNFHGYITHRGTTYNSYLVIDEKVAVIDFVKSQFTDEQIERIKEHIDPNKVNYIISNHAEPDHSGSIRSLIKACPNAEVIATERCVNTLKKYYGSDLKITLIEQKPSIKLGNRSLMFVPVPMAHWPDSMVSLMPEEKILFSNDAFGQHLATSSRFDDEVDQGILWQEASRYYANILMPLWRSVGKAIKALEGVQIEMIAPSHGVIWRTTPSKILGSYQDWVSGKTRNKVIIVYDSMWGSTQILANNIADGLASKGVDVIIHNLTVSHNSDVIADLLDAKAILVGSPTLNNYLFPSVAGFLAYLRGLKPINKIGAAFGSYGWAGGAKKAAETELQAAGVQLVDSPIDFVFKPSPEEAKKSFEFGQQMAAKIKSL
jgi:flavorubredoxin